MKKKKDMRGRPITINGERRVNFRLDQPTWNQLAALAAKIGISPSAVIREAIRVRLDRDN